MNTQLAQLGCLSLSSRRKDYPQNHLIALLDGFVDFSGIENYRLTFKGLSLNSKKVHKEFLFFACAGSGNSLQHGIAYAGEAINAGASCVLWEPTRELNSMPQMCQTDALEVPLIPIEGLHEKAGEIAARFYQQPSKALTVIGITGTNGKTSTAHFIAQLIHFIDNRSCALIGTLGNGLFGQLDSAEYTTPDAITLQSLMAHYVQQQVKTLVMEVSSHALSQGRVNGVEFDTAVFTNLSRDHLDYHGDMKSYAEEKLKLFQKTSLKNTIVNLDDAFSCTIIDSTEQKDTRLITYSRRDRSADYYAEELVFNGSGISFTLHVQEKQYSIKSSLVGDFNSDNLLAAIAVIHSQGYDIIDIIAAVEKISTVAGRMEKVTIDSMAQLPLIVVDYAHTPDALEKSLTALKRHSKGNLYCIFGCGGERDQGKRPLMAKVAQQIADHIIVTTDNPRTESEQQIINDIISGFKHQDNVVIMQDRKTAIDKTLEQLNRDDVLLIAGKGHEDYQDIKGQHLPFSDKAVVVDFYHSREQRI